MEIDMSLDDIIQKKRIGLNKSLRKGGFRGRQFKRNENNNLRSTLKGDGNFAGKKNRNGGVGGQTVKTDVVGGPVRRSGPVADARLKIIQKSRLKITDAREKLAEIAKQSDARLKLKKIQEKRLKTGQRQKNRQQVPLILRSVNPSITDPTITIGDDSDEEMSEDVPVLRRTVNNNVNISRLGGNGVNDIDNAGDMLTDDNDKMYSSWPSSRSISRLIQQPAQLKIVTHNEQLSQPRMPERWDYQIPASLNRQTPVMRTFGATRGSVFEEEDNLRSHRSRISQEMKARLDTPAAPLSRSMGVLSQPSSVQTSQPTGHRIVVSNLQPSVTHEDIKELFEDIGPLVTSRVVRPGTAEVIYVLQKHAIEAVEAYHNRQLDGQPMKCLLVNSRPPTLTSSARTGAKYPSSTKSAVLPDISAIHKALFNK
ncbi:uncharacterized protein LOC142323852 isoform X1 [Lycorma delicatula]|uniref:uncharacterized protein LOC142323852 isoform X1 n=1 Tax=Lycorma delicatula TaxID=130591 RepID=UPI003F51A0A3